MCKLKHATDAHTHRPCVLFLHGHSLSVTVSGTVTTATMHAMTASIDWPYASKYPISHTLIAFWRRLHLVCCPTYRLLLSEPRQTFANWSCQQMSFTTSKTTFLFLLFCICLNVLRSGAGLGGSSSSSAYCRSYYKNCTSSRCFNSTFIIHWQR